MVSLAWSLKADPKKHSLCYIFLQNLENNQVSLQYGNRISPESHELAKRNPWRESHEKLPRISQTGQS